MEPRQLRLPGFTRFRARPLLPPAFIPTNLRATTTKRRQAACDDVSSRLGSRSMITRPVSLLALAAALAPSPALAQAAPPPPPAAPHAEDHGADDDRIVIT